MLVIIAILLSAVYLYLGLKKPAIAVLTSPFVACILFANGVAEESVAWMTVALVFFIFALVVVAVPKGEPDSRQWPKVCAKWLLKIAAALLLLVVMGIVFGPLGVFGFIFFLVVISSIISSGLASKHATAAYVVSTIGSSMRQNLPLPMALESAAGAQTDKRARILQRIKKWLVQGYSLSESIKRGYPKCPGYAVAMIASAERINQLPLAIGAVEADMIAKSDETKTLKPVHPFYPLVVMVITFCMLWFVTTFIIPQFNAVLEEMVKFDGVGGAQLPAATRFLMQVMDFVGHEYGWLIGLVLALTVIVLVPVWLRTKFRPRRPDKPYLFSRIGDFIKWHLPVLHWFERNYSMVHVIELLRLSLNSGCTVNAAIASTLGLDVNNCFKKRLRKWLLKVEAGDGIAAAARESRLGSTLAWAFDERVNQGNTLAILETLESFYRSNYSYYVNLFRFIMWPCVTLILGAMVGFVVYALYSPIVAVISNLARTVYP